MKNSSPPVWQYFYLCMAFFFVSYGCVNIIITCLPWLSGYIQSKEVKVNFSCQVFKNDQNWTINNDQYPIEPVQLQERSEVANFNT